MSRHLAFAELSTAQFVKIAEANIEALNHALRDIAPDRLRLHLCWGNYEGPHHRDVPLRDILPVVLKARPHAISTCPGFSFTIESLKVKPGISVLTRMPSSPSSRDIARVIAMMPPLLAT